MKPNKPRKFGIVLSALLTLSISIAHAEEVGGCFITTSPEITSQIFPESKNKSSNLYFEWKVQDTVTQTAIKTKILTSTIEDSKDNFVSKTVYKISENGPIFLNFQGSGTVYDRLDGSMTSFTSTTGKNKISYSVNINKQKDAKWIIRFDDIPATRVICKIIYNKDPQYDTIYYASEARTEEEAKRIWDKIMKDNPTLYATSSVK